MQGDLEARVDKALGAAEPGPAAAPAAEQRRGEADRAPAAPSAPKEPPPVVAR